MIGCILNVFRHRWCVLKKKKLYKICFIYKTTWKCSDTWIFMNWTYSKLALRSRSRLLLASQKSPPLLSQPCRCSLDMQALRSFACFMLYVNRTIFVYSCGFFHAALLVQFIYVIACCRLFSLCCILFTLWIYRNSSVSAVDESLSSSWFEAAVKRATRVHLRTCLGRHMGSFLLGVCLGRIAVSGVCRCPAF